MEGSPSAMRQTLYQMIQRDTRGMHVCLPSDAHACTHTQCINMAAHVVTGDSVADTGMRYTHCCFISTVCEG